MRALLTALLCLLVALPAHADRLSVTPSELTADLESGAVHTLEITLRNHGEEAWVVRPVLRDLAQEAAGPAYPPPGRSHRSAASWIEVPEVLEAPGEETLQVPVRIEVPAGAHGTHLAALFLEIHRVRGGQVARLAVPVILDLPTERPGALEVHGVQVQAPSGLQPLEIRALASNQGDSVVHTRIRTLLYTEDGSLLGALGETQEGRILPGGLLVHTAWAREDLAPGTYTVRVVFEPREGEAQEAESSVRVPGLQATARAY